MATRDATSAQFFQEGFGSGTLVPEPTTHLGADARVALLEDFGSGVIIAESEAWRVADVQQSQEAFGAGVLATIFVDNPTPFFILVPPSTGVTFDIMTFLPAIVDLAATVVRAQLGVAGATVDVYDGAAGGYQSGFSGSVTDTSTATQSIQSFAFTRVGGWPQLETITVFVDTADDGGLTGSDFWSFSTEAIPPPSQKPFILPLDPAPGAVDVPIGTSLALAVRDVDDGISPADLTIAVDATSGLGTSFVDVFDGGGFLNSWKGSLFSLDGDKTFNFTLIPPTPLPFEERIFVRVTGTDIVGTALELGPLPVTSQNPQVNPYSFTTRAAPETTFSATTVPKDGGYRIDARAAATVLGPGNYRAYLGTTGSLVTDPVCYSGVRGQENRIVVTAETLNGVETGAVVWSFVTPPNAMGAGYDFRMQNLDDGTVTTFSNILTYVPHMFWSRTLKLRGLLSRLWRTGYREVSEEEFPQ